MKNPRPFSSARLPWLAQLYAAPQNPLPWIEAVIACLEDADAAVRETAMLVLQRCGAPGAMPLIALLDPEQPAQTRNIAAACLGRMGSAAAAAIPALGGCMEAGNAELRVLACLALSALGPAAEEELGRLLASPKPEVRVAALEALGRSGMARKIKRKIRPLLLDGDISVKLACAGCLAQSELEDPEGLPRLMAALSGPEAAVRAIAVQRIGELGTRAAAALPALLLGLRDEDAAVRAAAALALARMQPAALDAVGPLAASLNDPEPEVILNAALALGSLGPQAAAAAESLQKLRHHANSRVAQMAAAALEKIEPKG